MTRDSCPDDIRRAFEMQQHEARMTQRAGYRRHEWAEQQAVAGQQRRRQRTMLGRRVIVPCPEDDG